jgi:hypothetical protein
MGSGERSWSSRGRDQLKTMDDERREATIEELKSWADHGAVWRAFEISDELAVVELCTCYGERVDMVQSASPELIEFVRAHREQP